MKKGFLILLLFCSVFTQAQSLKDALFSGKLKGQPGTVFRKGDDLSAKIDTVAKTPEIDTLKAVVMALAADTVTKKVDTSTKTSEIQSDTSSLSPTAAPATVAAAAAVDISKENAASAKDNNVIWKGYMDSLTTVLKAEVLPSKKIKRDSYFVLIPYAIGTDGKVTVGNISVTPENEFLLKQIKDRIELEAPQLNPVLSSDGTPRKSNKKYSFTLVKE
jgi:hypothetical protein